MHHASRPLRSALLCTCLAAALQACDGEGGGQPSSAPAQKPPSAEAVAAAGTEASKAPVGFERSPRSSDPELARLRVALDFGRADELAALLPAAARAGHEEPALRARAMALAGRRIDALRLLAEARKTRPRDPEYGSTAAEIYAGAGAFEDALREILELEKVSKTEPLVLRARGVAMLLKDGGAAQGLALLEEARRGEPELPFTQRALAQAHLLVGKEQAKKKDIPAALRHAQASVSFDADDVDAERFLSECLAASGRYVEARAVLEALSARGVPLGAELALLSKNAGFHALLRGARDEALDHFEAARVAGLDDDALGSAVELLQEAARADVDAGVALFTAGETAKAAGLFDRALRRDPGQLAAMNHLAVCHMKLKEPAKAAELWRRVLSIAETEQLELPEPVHLNLARALQAAGDAAGAKLVLDVHLDRHPSGPWRAETEAALRQLDAPR